MKSFLQKNVLIAGLLIGAGMPFGTQTTNDIEYIPGVMSKVDHVARQEKMLDNLMHTLESTTNAAVGNAAKNAQLSNELADAKRVVRLKNNAINTLSKQCNGLRDNLEDKVKKGCELIKKQHKLESQLRDTTKYYEHKRQLQNITSERTQNELRESLKDSREALENTRKALEGTHSYKARKVFDKAFNSVKSKFAAAKQFASSRSKRALNKLAHVTQSTKGFISSRGNQATNSLANKLASVPRWIATKTNGKVAENCNKFGQLIQQHPKRTAAVTVSVAGLVVAYGTYRIWKNYKEKKQLKQLELEKTISYLVI